MTLAKGHDELVEVIALAVEESSLLDIRGIGASRKRAREDADLRCLTRQEQRRELGGLVRAFKIGRGRDPLIVLSRISESGESKYHRYQDIADLAERRFVDVRAVVDLTSNSIPANAYFIVSITERGLEALAEREAT